VTGTSALDALVEHEIAGLTNCPCGCARCRPGFARLEAAAPRQTRGGTGGRALPAWRGWTRPVSLAEIQQARLKARRTGEIPGWLRPFIATGKPTIYRITRDGIDRRRPMTIGMTERRKSIARRIGEHFRGTAKADPKVHEKLERLDPAKVLVQAGRLAGHDMSVSLAHVYEGWLQDRERPLVKDHSKRTFDEHGGIVGLG